MDNSDNTLGPIMIVIIIINSVQLMEKLKHSNANEMIKGSCVVFWYAD